MGWTTPHLLRRGARYSFRCRVPARLAKHVGRAEVVCAIGTGDGPLARLIATALAARIGHLWNRIMKQGMAANPEEMNRIVREWLRAELDRWSMIFRSGGGFERMVPDPTGEGWDEARYLFQADAENSLDQLIEEGKAGRIDGVTKEARELAARMDPPLSETSSEFLILGRRLQEAKGDLFEARIRWAQGDLAYRPPMLTEAGGAPSEGGPSLQSCHRPSRTLAEAVEVFVHHRRIRNKLTAKQEADLRGDLRLLLDALGAERHVGTITEQDAGRVIEALQFLPKRFRQRPELEGLPFEEMVEKARRLGEPPLHPRTIDSYLASIRALLDAELAFGQIAKNPFARKTVRLKAPPEQNRPFSLEELEAIFASSLFQGSAAPHRPYEPGNFSITDWRFWAPIIALLSGARVSEIAQLRPVDIRQEEQVWVIDINDKGGRHVKTESSRRLIPVHQHLVKLGLLDMAEERAARGEGWLLPEVPKPVGGDPGKQLSRWMSEKLLPRLHLKTRPGLGFHSLRHSLRTLLRSAGVEERSADRLFGHKAEAVGARYGEFPLAKLADDLNRITLPSSLVKMARRPSH